MNRKYKYIFFDFDGVLAESVNAKTEAFKELYSDYGKDIVNKVEAHHLENGGVSRFEKFKYYHSQFLGIEIDENKVQELAQAFSNLVLNKVISSAEVEGVTAFLEKHYLTMDFWVITGTPTEEIKKIVEARNMKKYFKGLYGSPEKKTHWTEFLIKKHGLKREEILFIGDATTDYNAASHSNIDFCLRSTEESAKYFADYKGISFSNFNELEKAIKFDI